MNDDFDLDAYLDAAAAWFSYDLSEESHAAVRANLALLKDNSANFMDIELDPHLDPASVLRL
jgi:hypothetical protein